MVSSFAGDVRVRISMVVGDPREGGRIV